MDPGLILNVARMPWFSSTRPRGPPEYALRISVLNDYNVSLCEAIFRCAADFCHRNLQRTADKDPAQVGPAPAPAQHHSPRVPGVADGLRD